MSSSPKVAVVTPVHNDIDNTLGFLASIERQRYPDKLVVVIDDGSTDGTKTKIAAAFPDTIVLEGDGNLWWTGSTNLGVRYALDHNADYVFTINNDVELGPGSLRGLINTAQKNPKTLVGAMVCYATDRNKVWYAGGYFDKKIGQLSHYQGKRTDFSGIKTAEWLTGMGVMIPVTAFRAAGLYDREHFPQYFSDADFSLRANKSGYKLIVDTDNVVYADITSSWLNRQKRTGKLNFLPELLFASRSPFSFRLRYMFYRRHWGSGFRWALVKLYAHYFWRLAHNFKGTMESV